MGPTRSTRLPRAIDDWFAARQSLKPEMSPSELLVTLIHGGLRLRDGYMAVHRRALEHYATTDRPDLYATYRRALLDTFGSEYVDHVERWLATDGVAVPGRVQAPPSNGKSAI
jgi:hypothetical protein